jgi:hypothetical protein
MILSLAACGAAEPEPVATATPVKTAVPTPVPTPEPTPEPTLDPNVSRTTGLPYTGEYKPVLSVIENSPAARPQTGLQTADIVYEVPVEGSITRFVCVFSDNVPEEIMPVRSGRVPFLYIQHEWDAVFMHYGGSGCEKQDYSKPYSYYGHELYDDVKYDVDGWTGKWNDYYHRVSSASAPHNVVGNPKLAQELYDYQPVPISWMFDKNVNYSGENISEINLKMCTDDENYVSYEYDSAQDVYKRFMMGKVFKSKETGEQVTVKNIIVQYSSYESVQGIKLWKLTGEGDADYYIGGKLVRGTWKRPTVEDDTVFFDNEGKQIILRPGNTWIHLHPSV